MSKGWFAPLEFDVFEWARLPARQAHHADLLPSAGSGRQIRDAFPWPPDRPSAIRCQPAFVTAVRADDKDTAGKAACRTERDLRSVGRRSPHGTGHRQQPAPRTGRRGREPLPRPTLPSCRTRATRRPLDNLKTGRASSVSKAALGNQLGQRAARHVLHRDEVLAVDLADLVHRTDVRMVQALTRSALLRGCGPRQ